MSLLNRLIQHLKPYHYHSHLIFQFILTEFMIAYKSTAEIDSSIDLEALSENSFQLLYEQVASLSGSADHHMRLLFWNEDGILARLTSYCDLLLHRIDTPNHLALQQEADRAWTLSIEALIALRAVSDQTTSRHPPFKSAIAKLQRSIERLGRLITATLCELEEDENITLFLVQHHKEIDQIYGPGYVLRQLRKMRPGGLKGTHDFLRQRYTDRGFENMLPLIDSKIAEIKS